MGEFQLILTVINSGYSDEVMAHAKRAGARGGTVLHARGTGNSDIATLFGITIQPEKELVLIISPTSQKDAIMQAIAKNAGINSQSNGIVFSLPISNTLGLFEPQPDKKQEEAEQKTEQPKKINADEQKTPMTEKPEEKTIDDVENSQQEQKDGKNPQQKPKQD